MSVTDQPKGGELDKPRVVDPQSWAHHVLDMDGGVDVRTAVARRPFGLTDRARAVKSVVGPRSAMTAEGAAVAQPARQLSARQAYQASPLSYLNAYGRSWSVWGEADRLEWSEFGGEERAGALDLWFRDVVAGSVALVSLAVTVGTKGPGVTGSYEVRSSDAPPRTITVTGMRDETVDVIVRPDDPFAVLVTVRPGPGLGYFALGNVCYLPL